MTTTPTLREAAQQALEALAPLANATTPAEREALTDADAQAADAASCDLRAALAEQAAEQARPDIIERLTYHALERDDLTLDDCLAYLAEGWKRVRGRTERQMVLQLTALLAGAPAAEQAEPVAWPFRCGQRKLVRRGHAQGLLREMAAWMRRDGVGDCEAVELVSAYIDAIEAAPPAPAAAEQAVAVPAGYALVPVEPTEAMLAAAHEGDRQYTLRNFGDVMTVMQGPYDHWHAMIAAAPPAPARQEPLTDEQIKAGLSHAIDHATMYETAAFKKGVRYAERAHGITAAPAEGGAA